MVGRHAVSSVSDRNIKVIKDACQSGVHQPERADRLQLAAGEVLQPKKRNAMSELNDLQRLQDEASEENHNGIAHGCSGNLRNCGGERP